MNCSDKPFDRLLTFTKKKQKLELLTWSVYHMSEILKVFSARALNFKPH